MTLTFYRWPCNEQVADTCSVPQHTVDWQSHFARARLDHVSGRRDER